MYLVAASHGRSLSLSMDPILLTRSLALAYNLGIIYVQASDWAAVFIIVVFSRHPFHGRYDPRTSRHFPESYNLGNSVT